MKSVIRRIQAVLWCVAAVAVLSSPELLFADIYMYINSQGVIHFTDTPTSSKYRLYIRERPKRSYIAGSPRQYDRLIREAAAKYQLSPALIKAIIKAESDFNPRAVSKKGARGLMQIMPENLAPLNITDPFNPRQNIMGGSRYFRDLHERYQGQLPLVLAAYNAGPTAVDQYQDIPPYPETQEYVKKVMKYYYSFAR